TLIFTPEQALAAAKAGASYVSPFAGRIDDLLRKRLSIEAPKDAWYPPEGLAASVRNPRQVRDCALAGADVATVPFEVIREMLEHQKTVEGMIAFTKD